MNAKKRRKQKPMEGQWFKVNPQIINQKLFKEVRSDEEQEITRKLIVEAFKEVKANPAKYARSFKTMIPEKTWQRKNVDELERIGRKIGDHMADWVEQSLEWAQRIANGETWEEVCNNPDTAKYHRIVLWKDDSPRIIGGAIMANSHFPTSYVDKFSMLWYRIGVSVPLIVLYK